MGHENEIQQLTVAHEVYLYFSFFVFKFLLPYT